MEKEVIIKYLKKGDKIDIVWETGVKKAKVIKNYPRCGKLYIKIGCIFPHRVLIDYDSYMLRLIK